MVVSVALPRFAKRSALFALDRTASLGGSMPVLTPKPDLRAYSPDPSSLFSHSRSCTKRRHRCLMSRGRITSSGAVTHSPPPAAIVILLMVSRRISPPRSALEQRAFLNCRDSYIGLREGGRTSHRQVFGTQHYNLTTRFSRQVLRQELHERADSEW